MTSRFIPLKVHSAFSLSEGMLHVEEIVDLCVMHNIPAVGLTDSGNLFGAFQFSQKAMKKGVQPILGCKIPFLLPSEPHRLAKAPAAYPLTLYAKNAAGYRNLVKLSSAYYRNQARLQMPGCTVEDLFINHEGLCVLTGGKEGFFDTFYLQDPHASMAFFEKAQATFGADLYIELSRQEPFYVAEHEKAMIDLAYKKSVPIVAAPEIFFKSVNDVAAHDALLCIAAGNYILEENRKHAHVDFAFYAPEQVCDIYNDIPEALDNTLVIAQSCGYGVHPHAPIFPAYQTPLGQDEELRKQARDGLLARLEEQVYTTDMPAADKQSKAQEYQQRLEFELDVIIKMGFSGYFLIVADFIKWAKKQNIPVGPGRGSGAGSVVAWALTITDPDPIRFSLLFERFLNPERVSMPDFDIDFCQDRRDEVIDYVRQKYGDDHVAQIITFGKLQARAVIRDVGRVLQMPYAKVDRISKMIPNNPANPIKLAEAIEQDAELRNLRDSDESVRKLLEIGLRLEGLYRHASTHAAGVVISGCPLEDVVALYYDPRSQMPATQFNMKDVEPVGLLKFDFLGLKTLTVLQETVRLLQQKGIVVDLNRIPLDDTKTFEMLQRMETVGVFQLEGAGMREALGGVKPDQIEDIIALVSLYRPGPMDNIPRYVACKHGREKPDYLHPLLEGILKETFGVMIYQEQVMQIAQVLSGYSLGGADLLRRAMGKKIKEEMDQQRELFVKGAAQNNVPAEQASMIFDQVAKFAGYGFNKSHATAYAIIAYQTAYLKANYPVEFMAATMTHDMHNTDKLALHRQELARLGIPLLPPDVNKSDSVFQVESLSESQQGIRYALAAIKNVGLAAMQSLVAERSTKGTFQSLTDFFTRLGGKDVNKRQLEGLVCAGAFDGLHPNRREIFENIDSLTQQSQFTQKSAQQNSLFQQSASSKDSFTLAPCEAWSLYDQLHKEMESLGFYLSNHPLSPFEDSFEALKIKPFARIVEDMNHRSEGYYNVAGVLLGKQERTSKAGNKFAFLQLSDLSGGFELTVFSEVFFKSRDILKVGETYKIEVSARLDQGQLRLNAQNIKLFQDVINETSQSIEISVDSETKLKRILDIFSKLPHGTSSVTIVCASTAFSTRIQLPKTFRIDANTKHTLATL